MGGISRLPLAAIRSFLDLRWRLRIEILILRHQLNALRRTNPKRLRLAGTDRLLFVGLYKFSPGVLPEAVTQLLETPADGMPPPPA
ncbi:MAG: hypothetical protein HY246_02390 [Proteobacteria bacterium]|nr:hypothetical protein [Pseudomonadota bacterium]